MPEFAGEPKPDPILGDLIRRLPCPPYDEEAFFGALRTRLDRPRPRTGQPRRARYVLGATVAAAVLAVAVSVGVLGIGRSGESAAVGFAPAQNWQSAETPVARGTSSPVTAVAVFRKPVIGLLTGSPPPPVGIASVSQLGADDIILRIVLPAALVRNGTAIPAEPHFAAWGTVTPRRLTGRRGVVTEYRLPGIWGHFRIRADVFVANPRPTAAQRSAIRAELARMILRPG